MQKVSADEVKCSSASYKVILITSAICSAFDRLKIPNSTRSMVLSIVAYSLGANLEQCTVSAESLCQARIANCQQVAFYLKASFLTEITDMPLTLHWDGMLLPDLTDRGEVDRLPILLSGLGIKKLVAALKLSAGSGQQMCDITMQALHDWNIPLNHVVSLCFDREHPPATR